MPVNNMHVDIVLNDFGHAEQTRVARCIVTEGELQVHADRDAARWQSVAEDAYARAGGDINSLYLVIHGDYMFATPSSGQASPQLDVYMQARAKFSGMFFPAMGNHECTGYTASNCGSGNTDGVTDNYTQFLTKMLAPIQQTSVYYSIDVNATDASWTSKFVFVAVHAWDAGQASWLQGVMAKKTTYTFVLRHESSSPSGTSS